MATVYHHKHVSFIKVPKIMHRAFQKWKTQISVHSSQSKSHGTKGKGELEKQGKKTA